MRPAPRSAFLAVVLLVAGACAAIGTDAVSRTPLTGIHKIQHVLIIMQENRSFDSYFGTFPGADGSRCDTAARPSASPTHRSVAASVRSTIRPS
jgi:phospholipase C